MYSFICSVSFDREYHTRDRALVLPFVVTVVHQAHMDFKPGLQWASLDVQATCDIHECIHDKKYWRGFNLADFLRTGKLPN